MSDIRLDDKDRAWLAEEYGLNAVQLDHFVKICERVGLDPLTKQIYPLKSRKKENRGGQWVWVETLNYICGIDGYRAIADRTGEYAGAPKPEFEDTSGDQYPLSCSVTVNRIVQGHIVSFVATAWWEEYAPYREDRQTGNRVLSAMWAKMPRLMLAKVAEALALRRAFPASYAGVYTKEEFDQASNEEREAEQTPAVPPQRAVAEKPKDDDLMALKRELMETVSKWAGITQKDRARLKNATTDLLKGLDLPTDGSLNAEQAKAALEFCAEHGDEEFSEALGVLLGADEPTGPE